MANIPILPPIAPLLVREKQLPALLGISRGGIRRFIAAGKFPPPIRLGRRCIAWRVVDIEKWVAAGCGRVDAGSAQG